MSLVLGLDSGGTKSLLALANRSGQVVELHSGDGVAPTLHSDWVNSLEALLAQQPEGVRNCDRAVLALPFHGEIAAYSASQIDMAHRWFGDRAIVENDVRIAFDGAFVGKPGALVLAGTGSMAWASLNGATDPHIRVGGWGDAFGDEGSAFWIGCQALNLVSRSLDQREPAEEFVHGILHAIGIESDQLIGWVYSLADRRKSFAQLAIATSDLAEAGNLQALKILERAADQLAEHLITAWRLTRSQKPLVWSYAGGVFKSALILNKIQERVGNAPLQPQLPPIGGALLRAALNAGWPVDERWISELAISLAAKLSVPPTKENGNAKQVP